MMWIRIGDHLVNLDITPGVSIQDYPGFKETDLDVYADMATTALIVHYPASTQNAFEGSREECEAELEKAWQLIAARKEAE